MTLGFFTIAALDLLGILDANTTLAERQGYIDWIYHCQVPSGGFRGFTGTDFGAARRTLENECWDPANVPATYFALATLLILGDGLTRVKRRECLLWLPKIQREDGSFGEVLGLQGKIEGGSDLRFCCCAAGIRYILRGKDAEYLKDVGDIDVGALVSYIEACQVSAATCNDPHGRKIRQTNWVDFETYDGGFSEAPFHESHGMQLIARSCRLASPQLTYVL
jgi:prenyltransferase beta subunit